MIIEEVKGEEQKIQGKGLNIHGSNVDGTLTFLGFEVVG